MKVRQKLVESGAKVWQKLVKLEAKIRQFGNYNVIIIQDNRLIFDPKIFLHTAVRQVKKQKITLIQSD